jgi:hypothetical protein
MDLIQIKHALGRLSEAADVRFGSKGDIPVPLAHFRFTPESRHRLFMNTRPRSAAACLSIPKNVDIWRSVELADCTSSNASISA